MPLPLFGVPTRPPQPSDAAAVIRGNASVGMKSNKDTRDGTTDSPANQAVAKQQLDLTRRMTEIWQTCRRSTAIACRSSRCC